MSAESQSLGKIDASGTHPTTRANIIGILKQIQADVISSSLQVPEPVKVITSNYAENIKGTLDNMSAVLRDMSENPSKKNLLTRWWAGMDGLGTYTEDDFARYEEGVLKDSTEYERLRLRGDFVELRIDIGEFERQAIPEVVRYVDAHPESIKNDSMREMYNRYKDQQAKDQATSALRRDQ